MKIGLVSQALPFLPSRGGFRLYGGNLIRHLSRRHAVHLVSFLVEEDAAHLDWARKYCASVDTIPVPRKNVLLAPASAISAHLWGRPLQKRGQVVDILRRHVGEWDVLHVEGGYMGGIVPADLPVGKVLSLHDSWTLRCDEMLQCAQSVKEKLYYRMLSFHEPRYERLVYPRFDRCTVVAPPDVEAIRKTVPNCNVELIPYGTDTEYFHPVKVPKEKHTLVFHSHLGYAPNIEAALEFANEILPLVRQRVPEAVFHLVGANPDPKVTELASRPGIRISANLPDLRPAVCSGAVYVCAIRHGTGLKSKMLEAMAMRLPIVGYPGATVGLAVEHGTHVMEAKDARQFAGYVVELLENPERAERMAGAGRKLVEEQYSWESRTQAYEALYERVIEERRSWSRSGARPMRAVARAQ